MSDDGFLKRWSRKKRAPEVEAERTSAERPPSQPSPAERGKEQASSTLPPPHSGGGEVRAGAPESSSKAAHDADAIDPATLPPLESLGPDSDYTVFLKQGVPEALKLAALRKAWMSDPFIRDFRSPAIDYGWDFTTPDYSLRAGDDVPKMLDRILPPQAPAREKPADPPADPAAAPEPARGIVSPPADLKLPQKQAEAPVPQPLASAASAQRAVPRKKHGGALPD